MSASVAAQPPQLGLQYAGTRLGRVCASARLGDCGTLGLGMHTFYMGACAFLICTSTLGLKRRDVLIAHRIMPARSAPLPAKLEVERCAVALETVVGQRRNGNRLVVPGD